MLCPRCHKLVEWSERRWIDHNVQGGRFAFRVCSNPQCRDTTTLCPNDLYGCHGEVIAAADDAEEFRRLCRQHGHGVIDVRPATRVGIQVCCGQLTTWYPEVQQWGPADFDTIPSLNDRFQRGLITAEEHAERLTKLLDVEA